MLFHRLALKLAHTPGYKGIHFGSLRICFLRQRVLQAPRAQLLQGLAPVSCSTLSLLALARLCPRLCCLIDRLSVVRVTCGRSNEHSAFTLATMHILARDGPFKFAWEKEALRSGPTLQRCKERLDEGEHQQKQHRQHQQLLCLLCALRNAEADLLVSPIAHSVTTSLG